MPARKIYRVDIPNQHLITLWQTGNNQFAVVYGTEEYVRLDYVGAAKQLGFSLMHALKCEGKIDNGR